LHKQALHEEGITWLLQEHDMAMERIERGKSNKRERRLTAKPGKSRKGAQLKDISRVRYRTVRQRIQFGKGFFAGCLLSKRY
jgi:hypothetical protein